MTLLIAAALVIAIIWLLRDLLRGSKKSLRQQWKIYGLLAGAVILLLAVTKKMHVLGLLAAAIVPILRQVAPLAIRFGPLLQQQFQRYRFQKPPPGQNPNSADTQNTAQAASVTTLLFHMTLDPQTGKISGCPRQGEFSGQALDTLQTQDLKALHESAKACPDDSLAVFEAYLQSRFGPSWRQSILGDESNAGTSDQAHQQSSSPSGPLTTQEAWDILGLAPGTAKAQIISRHKSLIQKLHPDRGGSTYLAVRINQARDLLLKKSA